MRALNYLLVTSLVFFAVCLHVSAADCPAVSLPGQMNADTRKCLVTLDQRFLSYTPEVNFRSDRNRLLTTNAYADQQLVLDVFFTKYCELIGEPRWNLSLETQGEKLRSAGEELYARVPFAQPVVDTRNLSLQHLAPRTRMARSFAYDGVRLRNASLVTGGEQLAAQHGEPPPDYLRDSPFVVTRANKNFVQVASVSSREEALVEIRRLKSRAPQFDFVAYEPYRGSRYYAIMMATWVPYSVATQALRDAREYVNDDSLIWACREEGDRC